MMSMTWIRAILLSTLFLSTVGFTTMRNPVSSMRGQISMVVMKKKGTPAKPAPEPAVPLFPYGIVSFKMIIEEKRFLSDKTMYIKKLEAASNHIKIWRPRRFGKTLVCDMLEQYYDKANSKTQKYYKAGLLDMPIEIDTEDALSSLQRLFDDVRIAGDQIYFIVDECDSFVNKLIFGVDISQPDLGRAEYKASVSGKEEMIRGWGNVIKEGTVGGTIARTFFTGVAPQAFSDGLSALNMVLDLTFDPHFAGMFGLTSDDVLRGLRRIGHLTEQQRSDYLEQMREQYDGYRFVPTQEEAVYNPQYVHYFLNHLDRLGVPPESLIDSAVSNGNDNVAEFLLSNYKSISPNALQNLAMGIWKPQEMGVFERDMVPAFRSKDLFQEDSVARCLISLAFYNGFLTFKRDEQGRTFLISLNLVSRAAFMELMFPDLSASIYQQLIKLLTSPSLEKFKKFVEKSLAEGINKGIAESAKSLMLAYVQKLLGK
ncbi:hypothetical protein B484DRAFT_437600 [Ochromonadaceae sp. CCMP2298]|nr:hypothetical protein B484DRAFT_437600 [Ochromonadaceae sp. CCMP2298]